MRHLSVLMLITVLFANTFAAQAYQANKIGNDRFSFKVQPYIGFYIDKSPNMEVLKPNPPTGINFGIEFPSSQQRPWQQYLKNATWGIGVSTIDFGHDMIGNSVALYPYLMLNCVRSEHFEMKVKLASGLAVVSEHWFTQEDTDPSHYHDVTTSTTFGCYLNAYLSAGLNLNFPITRNFAINSEFGFFHMSNGRTCMPNIGANVFYGGVGLITTINPDEEKEPIHFPDFPYRWSLNFTVAAGAQKSAIADTHRYLISSLHTGAIYNVCNWYGVGPGVDLFFNDAIDKDTDRSLYRKDVDYKFSDKLRAGIALNNEFKFGLVTAIFDWGVYFYNPSRNYYDHDHPIYGYGKRPLFYKNDGAGIDEAFHYCRFGVKCRVWDNLYLQATAKTHLQICEYVEFGVNYQLPFLSKSKRQAGKSIIWHHHKEWWND